ncbi:MAG: hypothetical protein ABEJ69_02820 [Candidatus Nanohaloarchaea archaeon]
MSMDLYAETAELDGENYYLATATDLEYSNEAWLHYAADLENSRTAEILERGGP